MEILRWIIVLLIVLGNLGQILLIDKPREPISREVVMVSALINAGVIYWVLTI